MTYPTGFAVRSLYDSQGYVFEDRNASNNQLLRRVEYMDSRNQITHQELGWAGKLRNWRDYDPATGLLEQTCVGTSYTCDSSTLTQSIGYTYDARGNFLTKSDFGTYFYPNHENPSHMHGNPDPNAGPNAVTRVVKTGGGTVTYEYDANGNLTGGDGRNIDYTIANKPKMIQRGVTTDRFWYSPGQMRWKRTTTTAGDSIQTYYVGKAYEYVIENLNGSQTIKRKHYVGDYMVMTRKTGAETSDDYRFLLQDHLGSVDAIADVNAFVIERKGYDVFGDTRTGDWRNEFTGDFAVTTRGFTGHEHLTQVGLIHMNGRAYDPKLGKFLSVDPFIQFPEHSQSLNGYTYILNNPLSGTDPTGYLMQGPGGLRGCDTLVVCTPQQEQDPLHNRPVAGGDSSGQITSESSSQSVSEVSAGEDVETMSDVIDIFPTKSMEGPNPTETKSLEANSRDLSEATSFKHTVVAKSAGSTQQETNIAEGQGPVDTSNTPASRSLAAASDSNYPTAGPNPADGITIAGSSILASGTGHALETAGTKATGKQVTSTKRISTGLKLLRAAKMFSFAGSTVAVFGIINGLRTGDVEGAVKSTFALGVSLATGSPQILALALVGSAAIELTHQLIRSYEHKCTVCSRR